MSFWKAAPYVGGASLGLGLSALENSTIGDNLPPQLKRVNNFLGASTGALFAIPGQKSKIVALGSLPIKQTALFLAGQADRFRQQQQDLTNTNLNTAKVNESAAKLHLRDAGTSRAIQLAFLIPALVGAGALGYGAYNQFKKDHKPRSKFKNLEETGEHKPSQRLKLEMPISALPADFVPSLLSARDRAHITVRGSSREAKAASFLNTAGDLALGLTGIPEALRGGKDLMHGFGSLEDSDYGNAARYTTAGLGGLGLAAVGARFGALPILGHLLGRSRLSGVIRNAVKGESSQLTEMPTFARSIYRHTFLDNAAGKNPLHQYDPMKYDWKIPTTSSGLFRGLLTAPAPGAGPKSLLGTGMMGAKYLGNRMVDTAYRGKQIMKRWPNATLTAAGLPLAGRGTAADDAEAAQEKALWDQYMPQGRPNMGPMGMPISSVAGSIINALSGAREPIAQQLSGR